MVYRKKRQQGYGFKSKARSRRSRRKHRGYGQRGKGPRWDKFKARVKKGWAWAKPRIMDAGKKAIPGVKNLLLVPKGGRRKAIQNIGKQFGKDLLHNMSKG